MSGTPPGVPTPISSRHRLDRFDCGKSQLDQWLRTHALRNEGRASRTFVIADEVDAVLGYYALATGQLERAGLPRPWRHDTPDTVPIMVLGRLAVDRAHAGRGLGAILLRDAVMRTLRAATQVGMLALVVHAIDEDSIGFYRAYGFQQFPAASRNLFLNIASLRPADD